MGGKNEQAKEAPEKLWQERKSQGEATDAGNDEGRQRNEEKLRQATTEEEAEGFQHKLKSQIQGQSTKKKKRF